MWQEKSVTCTKCNDSGTLENSEGEFVAWCDCEAGQDAKAENDDEARRKSFDDTGIAFFNLSNDGPANLHDFLSDLFGE
jgi:hypothetical protein